MVAPCTGAGGHAEAAAPPGDVRQGAGQEASGALAAGHSLSCARPGGVGRPGPEPDHQRAPAARGEEVLSSVKYSAPPEH